MGVEARKPSGRAARAANTAHATALHAPFLARAGAVVTARRLGIGLSTAAVAAALAYAAAALVVADTLTRPIRRAPASSPAVFDLAYEDVTFPSAEDGIALSGWFLPAEGSRRAVAVVHGRNSTRTGNDGELVAHAAALVRSGYNALLFDLRAHGRSGGRRYTLGADERRDVLGAGAYLEGRGFTPARTGYWAHSMGAAAVLLAAGDLAGVRAIVADSSFARLDDLLADELPNASGLPGLFNPAILFFGRTLFGLDAAAVNPVEAVAGLPPRSLFLIHAEADALIPVDHAARLAAAAGPAVHNFWVFPGGRHDRVSAAVPDRYRSRVLAFFDERLR